LKITYTTGVLPSRVSKARVFKIVTTSVENRKVAPLSQCARQTDTVI